MAPGGKSLTVGIVGPCAAGKTTLVENLKQYGIHARHIAQEHSYVADMWRKITNPDILIFLDASYPVTVQRRSLDWTLAEYEEQQRRLQNARIHATLYILTDHHTPEEITRSVLETIDGYTTQTVSTRDSSDSNP